MFARLSLALVAILILPSAHADCPMQKTQISGRIQSKNLPVADAMVQVNWDEQRMSNLSAETRTATDGSFELTLSIDSFGGRTLLAQEKCGYKLKKVDIKVSHTAYRAFTKSYKLAQLAKTLDIKLRAR